MNNNHLKINSNPCHCGPVTKVKPGRFITLEGGEGAGKTSVLNYLVRQLTARNIPCQTTREPGGCPLAEQIRTLLVTGSPQDICPETELLLLVAARVQHVRQVIQPALSVGTWILCDRFQDSTLAYQGFGRGLNQEPIRHLMLDWIPDQLQPELTLLLDVDPEIGLSRVQQRSGGDSRFEQESLLFHQRIRTGFLTLAAAEPSRIHVIPTSGTLEEVGTQAWRIMTHVFSDLASDRWST